MKRQIIVFALMAISFYSAAQEHDKKEFKEREISAKSANFTPNGNGAFSNVVSNLSLSSFFDEGVNGKAELKANGETWSGGLFIDQKIGKNAKKATPVDFNKGVSPGTTIGLNLQYMNWNPAFTPREKSTFIAVKNEFMTQHKGLTDIEVDWEYLLKNGDKTQIAKLEKIKNRNPVFYNLSVAFTKTKFSYTTDSVNLKKTGETHFTPSVSFAVGFPFSVSNYLAFYYTFSESYEAADEMNFNRKFGTTSNTFSQTLAFGKPEYSKDHKITAEYRQIFGEKSGFAVAPALTYGIQSKNMGIAIPVYFIKGTTKEGKPNGLQGGLSFGYLTSVKDKWSSFKEGFGSQLIITAPFSMFEGLLK